MIRNLLLVAVVALVAMPAQAAIRVVHLTAIAGAQECGAAAPPRAVIERFMTSEVVVAGKVASIEKDMAEATATYVGATEKKKYRVAVVKIDTAFVGADKVKEIKVGFLPWPKVGPKDRPLRTDALMPELKVGQELLLFLIKHPTADFYFMPLLAPPVDLKNEHTKSELDAVKRYVAVLADPLKGLKSDKAEARAETAAILLIRHRTYSGSATELKEVAIDADENKLILKGLAEGDWRFQKPGGVYTGAPLPYLAFLHLRLTEKEGWVMPVVGNAPGVPPPDFGQVLGDAFGEWLKGPGKNYTIKKLVPKKTDK
jgi:hypothetical protein